MKRFAATRSVVKIIFAVLIVPACCTRTTAADHAMRPVHQVLDKKPENLMLNYFVRVANELASRQQVPATRAKWDRRRGKLQNQLRETLGNFPWENRPSLNARITGRLDHGDHVVEKVLYESLPGLYVTALAYVPKNVPGRLPAVICVNGHWPDAKATELIQRRCMGLARMGVIAFCQDVIGTGERQAFAGSPPQNYHGFFRGAAPRIVDRTLQGYVMFECIRALDYLRARDDVDPDRIICTGASGGGMQSMFFAALDERLAGAVPVCYISSYESHMGATACVCEVPAGILRYSNQWEILALHAPRPLFCIAASRDVPVFQPEPMLSTLEKTRGVYNLYDEDELVTSAVVDSGHDYNTEMRELLYRHVARHLLSRPDDNLAEPDDLPVEPTSALQVGLPANTETMQSLTFRRAGELVSQIAQPQDVGHWQKLKQEQQRRLRDEILGGFPDTRQSKHTLHRNLTHNGHMLEHWTFEPEPGIVVPAVLCLPHDGAADGKRPAVLVVDEGGKQAAFERGLVDALAGKGFIVLAIDYRGAGETAGTVPAIEYGPGTPEYNLTNYSSFVGRPLAGARVVDIRCATDFLTNRKEVDAQRIAIVGRGRGALSAVLAASFDERLVCVMADEPLTSWVFEEEFVDIGLAYMIPRILTVADMPHLLAHVAPRPLLVTNPIDGRRRAVSVDDCRRHLRYTAAIYGVFDASEKLQVTRNEAEVTVRNLAELFQIHNY
ncbi:MAG: acetylxylan esterase [Planctomycetes bacterium]|nr:acetylxylan esterase [Planctomycetota bacterium]